MVPHFSNSGISSLSYMSRGILPQKTCSKYELLSKNSGSNLTFKKQSVFRHILLSDKIYHFQNAYFTARYRLISFPIWGRPAIFSLSCCDIQFVSSPVEDLFDFLLVRTLGHQAAISIRSGCVTTVGIGRVIGGPIGHGIRVRIAGTSAGSAASMFDSVSFHHAA